MNDEVETPSILETDVVPVGDERTWAVVGHLSALSGFFTGGFGCALVPCGLADQARHLAVCRRSGQGKRSISTSVLLPVSPWSLLRSSLRHWCLAHGAVGLALSCTVIFTIIAALNSSNGVRYRYPMTLRLSQ